MSTALPSLRVRCLPSTRAPTALPRPASRSFERLLFSIEQAWWHYEDHVREKAENANLKSLTLKEFTGLIFAKVPGLQPFKASLEEIYDNFNRYKRTVPVRRAARRLRRPASHTAHGASACNAGTGWPAGCATPSRLTVRVLCAPRSCRAEGPSCWTPT